MNWMEILTPALILGGLGLLFGALLTVASKKFAVEVDERVQGLREFLPGANCSGCGHTKMCIRDSVTVHDDDQPALYPWCGGF